MKSETQATNITESWIIRKAIESRIQAIEMKYLRKVKGVTKGKKRNDLIREELEIVQILMMNAKQQLK